MNEDKVKEIDLITLNEVLIQVRETVTGQLENLPRLRITHQEMERRRNYYTGQLAIIDSLMETFSSVSDTSEE